MSEAWTATDASAPGTDQNPSSRSFGLLIEFDSPARLMKACERVRDAGFSRWDAYSPFPVHGLDRAMGIRPTKLPLIVLACGLAGAGLGLLLQWWTNAHDYPFSIGGKPIFSLPANIPVTFETTILLAAFGAVFGMFALNALPRYYHPVFRSRRFRRATSDRFFISIEATDPRFDRRAIEELAHSLGADHVEELED